LVAAEEVFVEVKEDAVEVVEPPVVAVFGEVGLEVAGGGFEFTAGEEGDDGGFEFAGVVVFAGDFAEDAEAGLDFAAAEVEGGEAALDGGAGVAFLGVV